jgi:hypothetical protein
MIADVAIGQTDKSWISCDPLQCLGIKTVASLLTLCNGASAHHRFAVGSVMDGWVDGVERSLVAVLVREVLMAQIMDGFGLTPWLFSWS